MKNWLAWLLRKNNFPRGLVITGFIVALLGFADSSYLAFEKLSGRIPPCVITSGCDTVTTSKYSYIGPVPIAVLGALYYLTMVVLFLLAIDTKDDKWAAAAFKLSIFGFLFSIYLVSLQAFVLHAYCVYCMGSALTSTTLFGLAAYAKTKKYF